MRQVRSHALGGPEVLQVDDVEVPVPGPGELLVETSLIGTGVAIVRHAHDRGVRPLPDAPAGEVVGRVVARGPGVDGWPRGQRVCGVVFGPAYAEQVVVPAALAVAVPDDVDDATAVGLCRSGQVALGVARAALVGEGDRVLVTAAMSGVGHLAVQIAGLLGAARVTGAVGSPAKAARPPEGTALITYAELDGTEADVVLDGVGGEVGAACLTRLAPGGRLVVFSASGFPIDSDVVRSKALSLNGFTMANVARNGQVYHGRARELLAWAAAGRLVVRTHPERFSLEGAGRAHRLILERATTGKVLIDPRSNSSGAGCDC